MFVCVWGRPDVSVIISSVNINMTFLALKSLPCPEIISHSQSASNKQIQGFSSCRQFARQSRHESWNKFSSWMDFLCSKRIYGWVRTRSHTEKKKKKPGKRHARGSVKRKWVCCGGINGHYSLPRCIRFASHWLLKEPRLWLTSRSQTASKQHALYYLKMSCCFFCFFCQLTHNTLTNHITFLCNSSHNCCWEKLLLPVWFC